MLELFFRCFSFAMGVVLFGVVVVTAYVGIISKGRPFAYGDSASLADWVVGLIMMAVFAFMGYGFMTIAFR